MGCADTGATGVLAAGGNNHSGTYTLGAVSSNVNGCEYMNVSVTNTTYEAIMTDNALAYWTMDAFAGCRDYLQVLRSIEIGIPVIGTNSGDNFMGGLSLTNPGLVYDQGQGTDPTTGMQTQLPPIVKFFKNAALRGHQAALDEMSTVQPGTSSVSGTIPEPGQPDNNAVAQNPPRLPCQGCFSPALPKRHETRTECRYRSIRLRRNLGN